MRHPCGAKQRLIGLISQQRHMKAWIIWGRSIGFDPNVLLWLLGLLNQQLFMVFPEAQGRAGFSSQVPSLPHLALKNSAHPFDETALFTT